MTPNAPWHRRLPLILIVMSAILGAVLLREHLGFDALAVAMGNGRVLCWHPDAEGAVVCQPKDEFVTAWAVL